MQGYVARRRRSSASRPTRTDSCRACKDQNYAARPDTDWRVVPLAGDVAINDVDARGPDDVWLAGDSLLRFDGAAVSTVTIGLSTPLRFIHLEPSGSLLVDDDGVVHRVAESGATTTLSGPAG